jgi:hypothetical protein
MPKFNTQNFNSQKLFKILKNKKLLPYNKQTWNSAARACKCMQILVVNVMKYSSVRRRLLLMLKHKPGFKANPHLPHSNKSNSLPLRADKNRSTASDDAPRNFTLCMLNQQQTPQRAFSPDAAGHA